MAKMRFASNWTVVTGVVLLRSLSELIYGAAPSWKDPAKYSLAHGGKDGIPYPVDRRRYHKTIEIIENATQNASVGENEKNNAIRRLHALL